MPVGADTCRVRRAFASQAFGACRLVPAESEPFVDTRALPASTMMTSAGSGSVDVAPVVDANDDHLVVGVIDAVEHPIGPAPRYPNPGELTSELTPNPSWIVQ